MKKQSTSQSAFFNPRTLIGFVLCSIGVLLAVVGWSKSATDSLGNPVLKTGMLRHETTAQTPGTWTLTGSMNTDRGGHTATLLPNGKVLVAGGGDSAGVILSSAELYDPDTGTWVSTGSMTTPRVGQTATLLPDGKVLIAGGQAESCLSNSSAELYDPDTGTWSTTGNMQSPRAAHIAALITSGPLAGMVLAAGGFEDICAHIFLASAELYNPATGTWSATSDMTKARGFGPAAALPDASVLVIGESDCCHFFKSAESYDPSTQLWTPRNGRTTPANFAAVVLPDGKVLVAGGVIDFYDPIDSAELFDPSTGTWAATASMSTDRLWHTLTLLANGQALAAAGCAGDDNVKIDLTSAELYDSNAGTWFPTGDMSVPRSGHTATLLPNGQVLVAGGSDCVNNAYSSAELFTPPPVASLSTEGLTFGLQLVGTRSTGQTATLTNTGTTPLTISSIATSGDFVAKDNCGPSLPAGESCTIKAAFSPSEKGDQIGAVTITDDAADSPQTIALTGTGTVVALFPASVNFGDQKVGRISRPQTVTLSNTGGTPLSIRGIGIVGSNFGDFIETTTCGSSVPANSSCTIDVRFAPTETGPRTASVKVQHDGGGAQPIKLTGTGVSN